jgi:hypothetical protein
MHITYKHVILAGIAVVFALSGAGVWLSFAHLAGAQAGIDAKHCRMSTTARVTIGNQASTVVLATSTKRAFATIKQPEAATNSVAVRLQHGVAATLVTGYTLSNSTTSNAASEIAFGLSTDLPYVGAVTAISSTGSTSLEVEECVYFY